MERGKTLHHGVTILCTAMSIETMRLSYSISEKYWFLIGAHSSLHTQPKKNTPHTYLHHAAFSAYKLGPVHQDVYQTLEVQGVQLRVYPVRFPPFFFKAGHQVEMERAHVRQDKFTRELLSGVSIYGCARALPSGPSTFAPRTFLRPCPRPSNVFFSRHAAACRLIIFCFS